MSQIIIICISICIIIGIFIFEKLRRKKIIQQAVEEEIGLIKEETKLEAKDELHRELSHVVHEIQRRKEYLNMLKGTYDTYEKETKERIDNYAESYKEKAIEVAKAAVREAQRLEEEVAKEETEERLKEFSLSCEEAAAQLQELTNAVGSFQSKQEALNEEIRRRREMEEQNDFYRVCLSQEAIDDIKILSGIRTNLKKPEIVDKIIYDNYVGKPVLEMIKRVLQNTSCSGIYKITCIPTGEVYIGKSTDVKNRWQQHCKTAFNCGTIASSLLHTKMKQYGIENFTFELLEKVSKEELTEREKFYINFYQTKEVGLNERNG